VAARRLVIVMVVLLGLSTLATALVPAPDRRDEPATTAEGPTGEKRDTGRSGYAPLPGRVVQGHLAISNEPQPDIQVRPGDQLKLMVSGPVGDDVEIPAFGLTETLSPQAAARFDILVDRPGAFEVRAVEADRLIGRIVSCAARSPARGDGSRGGACGPRGAPAG
jgi:hypothetical protein